MILWHFQTSLPHFMILQSFKMVQRTKSLFLTLVLNHSLCVLSYRNIFVLFTELAIFVKSHLYFVVCFFVCLFSFFFNTISCEFSTLNTLEELKAWINCFITCSGWCLKTLSFLGQLQKFQIRTQKPSLLKSFI